METKKPTHTGRNIAIVVVIILLAAAGIYEIIPKSKTVSYNVLNSGTTITVAPGQPVAYLISLPPPPDPYTTIAYTLTGSFTATSDVAVYLVNSTSSDFSAFPTSYAYSSGNVTSGTISVGNLPVSNNYFLVIYNIGNSNTTVTITQPIITSGTASG